MLEIREVDLVPEDLVFSLLPGDCHPSSRDRLLLQKQLNLLPTDFCSFRIPRTHFGCMSVQEKKTREAFAFGAKLIFTISPGHV